MKTYKITLIGDVCVGKSSILNRLINDKYYEYNTPTIGVSFYTKEFPEHDIKLHIWDTCGMEKYAEVMKLYYRNISACLVVFDTTNELSIRNTVKWIHRLYSEQSNENILLYLVGNKIDNENKTKENDISTICDQFNAKYFAVSAKDNMGITELFNDISVSLKQMPIVKKEMPIIVEEKETSCSCTIQ